MKTGNILSGSLMIFFSIFCFIVVSTLSKNPNDIYNPVVRPLGLLLIYGLSIIFRKNDTENNKKNTD